MASIILRTDQTGANDPIYNGNPRSFNFSVTKSYNVASGIFSMKRGSTSTDGITATIYNAFNGGGTSVASVFIAAASFNQTYTDMTFNFSNYTLPIGDYSMVLSSTTNSGGNSNYFIKSGSFQITDSVTGQVIIVGIGIAASPAANSTLTVIAKQGFNQIASGGGILGPASNISLVYGVTRIFSPKGGIFANGTYDLNLEYNVLTFNGLTINGDANFYLENNLQIEGGSILNGNSDLLYLAIPELSNGAILNGYIENTAIYKIISENGILISGEAINTGTGVALHRIHTNITCQSVLEVILRANFRPFASIQNQSLVVANLTQEIGENINIDEQDLYLAAWESGNRDHWGLTSGIHKRIWSPKVRNQSYGSSILRNVQSSD